MLDFVCTGCLTEWDHDPLDVRCLICREKKVVPKNTKEQEAAKKKGHRVKESSIQDRILRYLNNLPQARAYNNHGSAWQGAGRPDIFCCYHGQFIAIEVKRPEEEPTKLQAHELQKLAGAGAITLVAKSLDDVKGLVQELESRAWD